MRNNNTFRVAGGCLIAAVLVTAVAVRGEEKRKPKFTISKETTYVTGPVDEDGYIDYPTALNERLGKGVTAENNANVLLWKAMGPKPEGRNMPAEFYKWMGIEEPQDNAEHQFKYMNKLFQLSQEELQKLYEEMGPASKRPWKTPDHPRLAEWLKANEKALEVVHEASKRTEYFSPLVTTKKGKETGGLIGALLPGVQKCRELVHALSIRAMLHLGEGRMDAAWQDLLACHRLGRLIARGGTLIEALVGIAIDTIASNGQVVYLAHARLNSKQALGRLEELKKLPAMPSIADKIELGERFMFMDSVMMLERQGANYLRGLTDTPKNGPDPLADLMKKPIHWDPALRSANLWYDRMVKAMRNPDRGERENALDKIEEEIKALKKPFEKPEELKKAVAESKEPDKLVGKYVGDGLVGLLMPAVRKVMGASDRSEQVQRNLHVAFALAAYRADNGRYPPRLDDLAPKYLAKVPGDIFSGKSLVYKPTATGYLFYSVGQNGKDEGGRWYDDEPRGDDPNVRMPLPKLPPQ